MVKDRIVQIIDYKGIAKESFFKNIGVSSANFRGKAKESDVGTITIAKILSEIPDVNPEWLITGVGSMLRDSGKEYQSREDNADTYPLLVLEAFAGYGDDSTNGTETQRITEHYEIPLFKGLHVDFMIPVKGSSMYPKYNSGDVVACRIINELLFIQWNKVYVIDTLSQGVILKRLKPSNNDETVICKSDNDNYEPFELPKSEIRKIAMVVGVVRLE